MKTEISPSDLGAHHIVDLPMFASNLAVTMSVTALLKDQNYFKNKFAVYTRGNTEMGLLSARRKIKFTFFFFFFFLPPPHTRRLIGNP